MDICTLAWSDELLAAIGVPRAMLPEIRSSAEVYGKASAVLPGVSIAAALGDQQAALFGQCCFTPGEAKCTYGTGSFLLLNTGTDIVRSSHGLLTTVGYKIGDDAPVYALEGSIAITGSLVQWFRDNLGLINSAAGDRDARADRRGQRRLLHRAGLLRAVRPALAVRGARDHRRAHLVHHQGPPGPRGAGGDRLADPRGRRRDERGLRDRADHAAGGRRHDRRQPAHAVRRGRAGRAGGAADGAGDGVARRRVRGRAGRRLLGRPGGAAPQLAPGRRVAAEDGPGAP